MKHAKIHRLVDAFLTKKVRIKNGGGWAPVTEEEMLQLVDILDQLVTAKYQKDSDGDLPVEFVLIDRNTCQRMDFRTMPYMPKAKEADYTAQDIYLEALRFEIAQYNLDLATSYLRESLRPVNKMVRDFTQNAFEMEAEEAAKPTSPVDRLGV